MLGESGFDGGLVGCGLAVVVVGEDDGAGVDVGAGDVLLREGCGDEDGGEALAEADYVVGGAGREFAYGGDAAEEVVEGVEVVMDVELERGEAVAVGFESELGEFVTSSAAVLRWRVRRAVGDLERLFALVAAGCGGGGEKRVGDFRHRGDDDDGVEVFAQARGYDGGGAKDGGGVFDGGATELHDDDVVARRAVLMRAPLLLRGRQSAACRRRWAGRRGSRTCP